MSASGATDNAIREGANGGREVARAERNEFFLAAMAEAGFPDVKLLDGGKTWTHPRIDDEDVRLASFRALYMGRQRWGMKLRHCWECYRDLPSRVPSDAWSPCEHEVVWA